MKINFAFLVLAIICLPVSANQFNVDIINDTSSLVTGGNGDDNATRTLGSITYETSFESWTFFAGAQALRGEDGGADAGVLQAYSNADEAEFSRLYEVFVQKKFTDKATLKVGQMDANSDFAYGDHAGEFIHSSMGFSPTISFLPTYPLPRLGTNVFYNVDDSNSVGFGMYSDEDNEFDEQFFIGEWIYTSDFLTTKLGVWHQTGDIEEFDDTIGNGATGFYAFTEGAINSRFLDSESGGWFLQLGVSDKDFAEITLHVGAGIVWYQPFKRENDVAGAGFSYVETSDFLQNELASDETAFELFYRYQLNDYISFKPDLQYIVSPAASTDNDDAFIFTMRTELSF